jgi:hypothetical protein
LTETTHRQRIRTTELARLCEDGDATVQLDSWLEQVLRAEERMIGQQILAAPGGNAIPPMGYPQWMDAAQAAIGHPTSLAVLVVAWNFDQGQLANMALRQGGGPQVSVRPGVLTGGLQAVVLPWDAPLVLHQAFDFRLSWQRAAPATAGIEVLLVRRSLLQLPQGFSYASKS